MKLLAINFAVPNRRHSADEGKMATRGRNIEAEVEAIETTCIWTILIGPQTSFYKRWRNVNFSRIILLLCCCFDKNKIKLHYIIADPNYDGFQAIFCAKQKLGHFMTNDTLFDILNRPNFWKLWNKFWTKQKFGHFMTNTTSFIL